MTIARRALTACTITLAVLCAAPAVGALASTTASHTAVNHMRTAPTGVIPDSAPNGCPPGDMCIYSKGNGGNLCIATPGNEPNLGSCSWIDQSVFNNGYTGNYNGVVAMNHLQNYTGAWTCIATGKYWLYTSEYFFNGGPGTNGYGETVANAVASFHWQHNNCGSNGP